MSVAPAVALAGRRPAVLRRAPELVLALGTLAVAALAASVAVDINYAALDETVYKQSAVHYSSGLPGSLFDDVNARATSRLYPLLISPLFAILEGDQAIRAARALNGLLFASAAIPTYLLAREVVRSRWTAVAAGLLSVAVPWIVITTTLFTESLAYTTATWALWAGARAVRAPSPGRDLVALVCIGLALTSRTQLAALLPAYWLAALAVPLVRARARAGLLDELPLVVRRWARGLPFSIVGVLAGGLALAVIALAREGSDPARAVFGGAYINIFDRGDLPRDVGLAVGMEVLAFALGTGILPVVAALAWLGGRLRRPLDPRWPAVVTAVVMLATLMLATLYAQGGYQGDRTEERYYLYVLPLVWVAALAAVERREPSRRAVLGAGAAVALLFASIPLVVPLSGETAFLAPAQADATWLIGKFQENVPLGGISRRDLLFAVTLLLAAGLALAWRRRPAAAWALVLVLPALAQAGVTSHVYAVVRGEVEGVGPRTGDDIAERAWIDRALPDGRAATFVNSDPWDQSYLVIPRQRELLFWNDQLRRVAVVPALGLPKVVTPVDTLPAGNLDADIRTGRIAPAPAEPIVQLPWSQFVQVAGRRVARGPNFGYELVAPAPGGRVGWLSQGLDSSAWIPGDRPVRVLAAPDGGAAAVEVKLRLEPPPEAPLDVEVRLGGRTGRAGLPAGAPARDFRFVACTPGGGPVAGTLRALSTGRREGRAVGGRVARVDLADRPAAPGCR